ncbi:caax amino protease family protein [Mycobacterium xenopi 3993]|nr:caax amino protease family protein [Mycobacterium xenopi 3993]
MTDLNTRPASSALDEIRRAITNVAVPHHEPPSVVRRRRVVVAVVLVLGAVMLGLSMSRHPGEASFYWLTAALAALWVIGPSPPARCIWVAFAGGPQSAPGDQRRDRWPVAGGVFVAGGVIAREIPAVSELITRVLQFADQGSWRLTLSIALLGRSPRSCFTAARSTPRWAAAIRPLFRPSCTSPSPWPARI